MNLFAPQLVGKGSEHPLNVRGTELAAGDPRDLYRQKIARITLDSMVQFVGLLDANGTVLEINQVALDAVGIKLSEVEGKPFWTTFWWQVSEEIRATLMDAIQRAAGGEFVRWDTEIYGRAGGKETIIIDASLCPVKDDAGNVVFITAEGRDITEKKAHEREIARQREELAKLDELKTQFFANISHEFRTPLTLMMGPLEDALAGRDDLSPAIRESLKLAQRNSLRLLKLVNTLLDFSRIEAGRMQASYEPTDLAQLTAELASVFRSTIERAGLRLIIDCPPIAEPVYVDCEMWEKIVLNLLSNAFKFTFAGEIEVALRSAGANAEMSVRDTGTGIPPEEIPRLFERFHRVKGASGRSYEGSGIGLALVQELVKLHGGTVRTESELNRGTRFIVSIPLGTAHLPADRIQATRDVASTRLAAGAYIDEAERWSPIAEGIQASELLRTEPANAGGDNDVESSSSPKEVIVLADDNADMRDYLARLLGGQYRVHAVSNGVEAIDAARQLHPALLLTDVMMPELDGFGVLRTIRDDASLSGIPVLLLSARAGEESRVEGLNAGADDYLVKPFTSRELLARVATHIKMARLRREAAEKEARLRAEAEIERHRLQELLAQAPAGIGLLNGSDLRWTFVNNQFIRISGRSNSEDFLDKTLRESLPEFADQGFHQLLAEAYRTGEPYVGREMRVVLNRTGTGQPDEAYFDFVYQPVRNSEGKVDGILIHAVETTDRVMARRSREENVERLRLAQRAAQIGTWEWDPTRNSRALSPELRRMFGTDDSDDGYHTWESRVHPDDWGLVVRCMTEGDRTGTMEFEYRYNHPQDGMRWFCCIGRRLKDETRMFGIVQDVTGRKVAEEASHRLAAIVQSSDDAIIGIDLDGGIMSWNPAASRIFGYSPNEIIGWPVFRLIPERLHPEEHLILERLRNGESVEHYETTRLKKSGESIEVSLSISPIRDGSGQLIGASKIVRDVSERKRLERLLIQSEKFAATGRMAATVAHEINNPLESVLNLIYLARKHSSTGGTAYAYLQTAEQELERVSHIARQTLGYYRDTGAPVEVQLHNILNEVLSVYETKIRAAGIMVDCRFGAHRPLRVRKGEILQVFSNVIANAIDSMPNGGRLRIEVAETVPPEEEGVHVLISDDGTGIRSEFLDKVFEPFFTTKGDLGTGIGLWVSKQLVEKHDGRIAVDSSTDPGRRGTSVAIFFPRLTPDPLPSLARQVSGQIREGNPKGGN